MGRAPCCEKDSVKRGPWTPEEDAKLLACIGQHGTGSWRTLPKKAGLQRCGKSCRLRWTNYLRPDLKHGRFTDHEEQLIVNLHAALGSRWSLIAAQLPGRTDNDVKNYWNTRLKKKLCEMGIDPITHKPISQLLADLAGSMALPKGGEIAEAALGCFKDDMLNVLMRKRPDWQLEGSLGTTNAPRNTGQSGRQSWSDLVATTNQLPCGTGSPKSVLSTAYESGSMSDQRCSSDPSSARLPGSDAVVQKIKYSLAKAVQSNIPGSPSVVSMHMVANGGSTPSSSQCNGSLLGDSTSNFVKADQFSHHMAVAAMRSRFSGEAGQNYNPAGQQFIALGPATGAPDPTQKSMMDIFMDPGQGINARTSMSMLPNLGGTGSLGLSFQMQRDLGVQGANPTNSVCKTLPNWEGNNVTRASPPTSLGLHLPSSSLQGQHAGYRDSHQRAAFFAQGAPVQHPQQEQQLQQQELVVSAFGKSRTEDQDMGQLGRASQPASPSESGCSPNQSQNMQMADSGELHNGCKVNGKNSASPIEEENKNPWSPSASGSSCSSTSLAAADAAIDGVLNSDVLLWDFSELSSIIN